MIQSSLLKRLLCGRCDVREEENESQRVGTVEEDESEKGYRESEDLLDSVTLMFSSHIRILEMNSPRNNSNKFVSRFVCLLFNYFKIKFSSAKPLHHGRSANKSR